MSKPSVHKCIKELHLACRDVGFVALSGHGIPMEIREKTLEMCRNFFSNEESIKMKYHISNFNNCFGYQKIGENITQSQRDIHEGLDYYKPTVNSNHKPFDIGHNKMYPNEIVENFEECLIDEYVNKHMLKLGNNVMQGIALSLKLPFDYFDKLVNDSFWVIRSIHYPLPQDENEESDRSDENDENGTQNQESAPFGIACGEHQDYGTFICVCFCVFFIYFNKCLFFCFLILLGCLTFINQDSTKGCLQIKNSNGEWLNVDPIENEDCLIVNLGDMLHLWTGGLYQSTPHRVIPPKYENIDQESHNYNSKYLSKYNRNPMIGRISIPFFFEPNWDCVIRPIDFDFDINNQSEKLFEWDQIDLIKYKQTQALRYKMKSTMYGDHLKSKVFSNFYTTNTTT